MTLSAPSMTVFIIAVILAVLGLLGALFTIPVLSAYAIWLALLGFVVLAVGCLVEGE